jgi:RNA recognition motif. (a.k.a. RRM, RBD, or RNP domain)
MLRKFFFTKLTLIHYKESLREIFSSFGTIAAAKVMVDKVTGESRQIGFVRYHINMCSNINFIWFRLDMRTKKKQQLHWPQWMALSSQKINLHLLVVHLRLLHLLSLD